MPNLIQVLYKTLLQPSLFCLDAETAHNAASVGLSAASQLPGVLPLLESAFRVSDPRLAVTAGSIQASNPVGLAAGFDKHVSLADSLQAFGFGFIEVGTITPLPQAGRDKPRLFRIKPEQALINRMGFNNPGSQQAAENLKRIKPRLKIPLGINIGKGKETPLDRAREDYLKAFHDLASFADYAVLNVSSPNTPNLRALQEGRLLEDIIKNLLAQKPHFTIFTKVAPDATDQQLEEIAGLAFQYKTGLVATNTTIDRSVLKNGSIEEGGISGAPLRQKANRVLKRLYDGTRGQVPIIGVGGVFSAEDAYEKIRLGASLVQVYTGWIYEGPGLVPAINRGLLRFLDRDGFKNVKEAVGTL